MRSMYCTIRFGSGEVVLNRESCHPLSRIQAITKTYHRKITQDRVPYLILPELSSQHAGKVTRVVVVIESHDQGWSDFSQHHGKVSFPLLLHRLLIALFGRDIREQLDLVRNICVTQRGLHWLSRDDPAQYSCVSLCDPSVISG
jgi:hypothetical protein